MTTILPNEEQLLTFNEEQLVLTTQRIQIADVTRGNIELPLEQVSSVTVQHRGYKLLLLPGCISLLAGLSLWGSGNGQFEVALVAGIILMLFWWVTRKRLIAVTSDKDGISNVDVDDMSGDEINALVHDIQAARDKRLSEVKQPARKPAGKAVKV